MPGRRKPGPKRGGALQMSGSAKKFNSQNGNGAISDLLSGIPIFGNIAGAPLRMLGLGRRRAPAKPRAPRRKVVVGGSYYGDVLSDAISKLASRGTADLSSLVKNKL